MVFLIAWDEAIRRFGVIGFLSSGTMPARKAMKNTALLHESEDMPFAGRWNTGTALPHRVQSF